MLEHRRLDVVLVLPNCNTIFLFEIVCAFISLFAEQTQEKYEDLAAVQNPSYSMKVVPVVIRDLGSIAGLSKPLQATKNSSTNTNYAQSELPCSPQ